MRLRRQQYLLENELDKLLVAGIRSNQKAAAMSMAAVVGKEAASTEKDKGGEVEERGERDGDRSRKERQRFEIGRDVSKQRSEVERLAAELAGLRLLVRCKARAYDEHFHPRWGQASNSGLPNMQF